MVLLDIDVIVYHEVLKRSKSLGTFVLLVKLCVYYVKDKNTSTLDF